MRRRRKTTADGRDALEVLRVEPDFNEEGGDGRRVRAPRVPVSVFRDSLSCLNFGYPYRARPCGQCLLGDYVPEARRPEVVPCQHIPLDPWGETIEDLGLRDTRQLLEEKVKDWLRARIKQLEWQRAEAGGRVS